MSPARSLLTFMPCALAALVALHGAATASAMRSASASVDRVRMAGVRAPADEGSAMPARPSMPIFATSRQLPRVLAGAVAAKLREVGAAQMTAVGADASYNALKAIILATRYVEADFPGKVLAATVSKHAFVSSTGQATHGYLLGIRAVNKIDVPDVVDTVSSADVTTGTLAKFISDQVRAHDIVTVGAMGARAVYNAMKSIAIAQSILDKSPEAGGSELVLVPSWVMFVRNGRDMWQTHLACVRSSAGLLAS